MADIENIKRGIKLGIVGTVLAWYALTGSAATFNSNSIAAENAPKIVQQVDGNLESMLNIKNTSAELPEVIQTQNGPIYTNDFDFSGEFDFSTERYRVVKDEDFGLSRAIGWVGSLPAKIFFLDYDIGKGLDETRVKEAIAMLENDPSISNVTLRLNHTGAIEDLGRLFTDEKVVDRNPLLARVALGVPTSVFYEMWAELSRGDYYNPLTQTVVVYSNIESITAHELGHHKDFQRFRSDWGYSLIDVIPGVRLYKEARASLYAKDMLKPEQNFQFYRYLIPAFMTYVAATYSGLKKKFFPKNEEK